MFTLFHNLPQVVDPVSRMRRYIRLTMSTTLSIVLLTVIPACGPRDLSGEAQTLVEEGVYYFNQGNYQAAMADLDHAIELDPQLANAYSNRGGVYYALGDLEAALTDLDHAMVP